MLPRCNGRERSIPNASNAHVSDLTATRLPAARAAISHTGGGVVDARDGLAPSNFGKSKGDPMRLRKLSIALGASAIGVAALGAVPALGA